MMKKEDTEQRRENYRTHFGPEPEDEDLKRKRLKDKASVYKDSILHQIAKNEQSSKLNRSVVIAFENLVVDAHAQRLREEEERTARKQSEMKKAYKEAWQNQMKVNTEKKQVITAAGGQV